MKDDNIFLWVKAVIAAACGAFTAAFGWLGWLVVAWAACMVLDWLSGSAAAASRGEWSSAVATSLASGTRPACWSWSVCVAALTDAVLSIAVANLPGLGITYQKPDFARGAGVVHFYRARLHRRERCPHGCRCP